ncbi:MAG TPA: hypothetical protein VM077_01075 [Candidatus Limnocylindrales bacterium]|nr:hypothetical protein [Candidatus Limnocylindrales bacterium]
MHELAEHEITQIPISNFDLDSYLYQRECSPNFVVIEIGHGGNPITSHQVYKGKRAYIGIESWQRRHPAFDKIWSETLSSIRKRKDENIFFVDQDTGFKSVNNYENNSFGINNGRYDESMVETEFPDGAADEVYLSNVFGDRQVTSGQNTKLLLKEVSRLVDRSGKVVIRESLTPDRSLLSMSDQEDLQNHGLKLEAKYTAASDLTEWRKLETVYKGAHNPIGISTDSYYLILSKISD